MISIEHISKKFGKLIVLKNISVRADAGQCLALLGPNGCGKTTLIKSILGMVIPDTGNIMVNNEKAIGNWDYRKHIGYMPQIGRYPDNMTIDQLLSMIIDIRKSDQLDDEILNAYGLKAIGKKRLGTLSGGTMQKVSAAIAFLFNPSILILDEPTAGLDPVSAEILKNKIQQAVGQKKLVLITSHVLSELEDIATDIVYMQSGEILFSHKIEELKAKTSEVRLGKAVASLAKQLSYE